METNISFNELVEINKINIDKYNEYMYYLKSIFRTAFENILNLEVIKKDDEIVLEIQYRDMKKINYFNIVRSIDEDIITINGKNDLELHKKIIGSYNYIFEDLKRFCDDNEFMERQFIKIEKDDVSYIINILPNIIMLNYKQNKKELNLSYDKMHYKCAEYNNLYKFINNSNSYDIQTNNRYSKNEINQILNEKIISIDNLPDYLKQTDKKLIKQR